MTVTCHGSTFNAHQVILCKQSPFFEAAMSGRFKHQDNLLIRRRTRHRKTPIIFPLLQRLRSRRSRARARAPAQNTRPHNNRLQTSEGPSQSRKRCESDTPYTHLQVYRVAEKYGIEALKELASERFVAWCEVNSASDNLGKVHEDAMAMKPPHGTNFDAVVARVVAANVVALVQEGSITRVLRAYPTMAGAVITRLVKDDRVWAEGKEEGLTGFVNRILRRGKCLKCNQWGDFRIDMELGDFAKEQFHCTDCGMLYDNKAPDYSSGWGGAKVDS
ncbi:BTB/POZ domain-containing protein [Aspergillus undulatus]|uniref:BTB/POZ domain-containing protein n=1 Tax=Aspergillus undulatus TaxID=1810928 RepID=UPI003CCCC2EB